MDDIDSVPCQHIADYYQSQWESQKCIAYNLLRQGYKACAQGHITSHVAGIPANNLYQPPEPVMLDQIEYLDAEHEFSDEPEYDGPSFYVIDSNGIIAGPFDDEGEAMWWQDKAKRV